MHIGILSDTHGYFNKRLYSFFEKSDELWHCGDIGNYEIIKKIQSFKPLRAVFGNIDGQDVRVEFNETEIFQTEDVKVLMTHIGGYPGNYYKKTENLIKEEKPKIFLSGHSHILKVIYDKKNSLLHINPGAAGPLGIHKVCTAIRLQINGADITDLEIMEYPKKTSDYQ
jgi:putative phosphoesterase